MIQNALLRPPRMVWDVSTPRVGSPFLAAEALRLETPPVLRGVWREAEQVKAIAVVNRATGERLTVELEIGQSLWLTNDQGSVEKVERAQLPAERWQIIEADPFHCWDGGGQSHHSIKCEVESVFVPGKA